MNLNILRTKRTDLDKLLENCLNEGLKLHSLSNEYGIIKRQRENIERSIKRLDFEIEFTLLNR